MNNQNPNVNPMKQGIAQKMMGMAGNIGSAVKGALGAPQAAQASGGAPVDKGYQMYRTAGGVTYMVVPNSSGRKSSDLAPSRDLPNGMSDDTLIVPYQSHQDDPNGQQINDMGLAHHGANQMDEVMTHYRQMKGFSGNPGSYEAGGGESIQLASPGNKSISRAFYNGKVPPAGNSGFYNGTGATPAGMSNAKDYQNQRSFDLSNPEYPLNTY